MKTTKEFSALGVDYNTQLSSEVGTYDYNEGGGDFQIKTRLDDEFKVPSELTNKYTYNNRDAGNFSYAVIILGDNDTKMRLAAEGLSREDAFRLQQEYNKKWSNKGIRFVSILEGQIPIYKKGREYLPVEWAVKSTLNKTFMKTVVDGKDLADLVKEEGIDTTNKSISLDSMDFAKTKHDNMMTFSEKKDNQIKPISELSNGDYKGYRYGYIFELESGDKYKLKVGVRNSKEHSNLADYTVEDGKLIQKQFTGISEVGGALEGQTYGKKPDNSMEMSKVSIDKDFNINTPKGMKTFSIGDKDREVTSQDLHEFKSWTENKDINPRLRREFDSDDDYFKYMDEVMRQLPDDVLETSFKGEVTVDIDNKSVKGGNVALQPEGNNKLFSGVSMSNLDTQDFGVGNLIGTLMESITYTHLFHFVSYRDYGTHMALQSYYESMPDKVDSLAEKVLFNNEVIKFRNEIFPKGCPVDYLSRLKEYVIKGSEIAKDLPGIHASSFQSIVDDIINSIDQCLYRLVRLGDPTQYKISEDADLQVESQPLEGISNKPIEYPTRVQVPNEPNKTFSENGACPESGCVQKKPNGKWGVISNKSGEFWDADYDSEDKAKNALKAYHAHFSELGFFSEPTKEEAQEKIKDIKEKMKTADPEQKKKYVERIKKLTPYAVGAAALAAGQSLLKRNKASNIAEDLNKLKRQRDEEKASYENKGWFRKMFDWDHDEDMASYNNKIEDKQHELEGALGHTIFSDKSFSEVLNINTPEEFRSYAHNLMKNAHKENYSESKTNKVVDDLLKTEYKDFGELIGKLKSGLGT